MSAGFNASLYSRFPFLESSLGINIVELDIWSIGKELKNNPAFGFTNTTQSALLTGNAVNADQFLYWDTVHPTSRGHDIFAARAAAPIPEPSIAIILLLFTTCILSRRHRACV